MAMSTSSQTGVQSTPNVTPMIDVMLVLLIIFMIVTPALLAGFQAEPPPQIQHRDDPRAKINHPFDDRRSARQGDDRHRPQQLAHVAGPDGIAPRA